jgi:hypothetical protein
MSRKKYSFSQNRFYMRKKEQSLSARCTEPARCPVASKLSVVTRFPPLDKPYGECQVYHPMEGENVNALFSFA